MVWPEKCLSFCDDKLFPRWAWSRWQSRDVLITLQLHVMQCTVLLSEFCLSIRCVYCDKTKWCTADILIPHETAINLLFWHQHWLVGNAPSLWNLRSKCPTPFENPQLRPISAHNVSTVGASEKSLTTTNMKSTTGFPTSYRWSAYITPKSRKSGSKSDFFIFRVKVNGWSSQALST